MKQKIIVKVQMRCNKCRTNAMKIAATASGIIVTGNGVDPVRLTNSLRKKVGFTTLLSVEELKDETPQEEVPEKEEEEEKKPDEDAIATPIQCVQPNYYRQYYCPPQLVYYQVVRYDPDPYCTIV
ncbi:hypothetical protein UlMin_028734 [Ulmus minor]